MNRLVFVFLCFIILSGCLDSGKRATSTPVESEAGQGRIEPKWWTNLERAKRIAEKYDADILLSFNGSDWCKWCIRLEEEVFEKQEFLDYAAEHFVLVLIDFPRKKPMARETKAYNDMLRQQYKVQGFPTVLILDSAGEVRAKTGYVKGGPAAFIKRLRQQLGEIPEDTAADSVQTH